MLNITVRELTLYDRVERNLSQQQRGLVVERVENGGYGGLAHLKEADLIVRIDGAEVREPGDLERLVEGRGCRSRAAQAQPVGDARCRHASFVC